MQRLAALPQLGHGQSLNRPSWPPGQRRPGLVYRRTFRLLAKLREFVYRGTVYSSITAHLCATKLPKNPRQHWIFSPAASKNGFFAATLKASDTPRNTRLSAYIWALIHRKRDRFVYRRTNTRLSRYVFFVYRRTGLSSIGVHATWKNPCATRTYSRLSTA